DATGEKIDPYLIGVGAREVADRDGVGAPERMEQYVFDLVQIHAAISDVAGELHMRAVGRYANTLRDIGAVENQRIVPSLPIDNVAPVTRIPYYRVVAGAAEDLVVSGTADQRVVTIVAKEKVGATFAR